MNPIDDSPSPLRVTYLTAGAAGMFCGSCMHDNTLARALIQSGVDVQLVPMYTPIRTDEHDVTIDRVFFGGLNVFLQQKVRLFRHLPPWFDRLLDRPALLRWIGSRGVQTSARQLGELAVSMLRGSAGFQRKEVARLCQWLLRPPRPDVVVLTNALVAGCVPDLKAALKVPIAVTLQGDDVFLEELPEPYKGQSIEQIRRLADHVDAFLVHSRYYADFMAEYLSLDPAKFHRVPLGIDTSDFPDDRAELDPHRGATRPLRVGYLARLAPEKGLHLLVEAFLALKRMEGMESTELSIAGWLGPQHQAYAAAEFRKLDQAGLQGCYRYWGTVDRPQKRQFLAQLDVMSVPTTYREPKGLYVLEALAAGVPVVQPNHGAFPELLAATGGGLLVTPQSPGELAEQLHRLLRDQPLRTALGQRGRESVHQRFHAQAMARDTLDVLRRVIG